MEKTVGGNREKPTETFSIFVIDNPWVSMVSLGSVRGHFGITLGLLWDQFGVTSGLLWRRFGVILGSLWG